MRKFEVGDIVNWARPEDQSTYQSGPYIVAMVHRLDRFNKPSVFLTRMDGSALYFRMDTGHPERHEWINEDKLRMEPFLDAARKANLPDATRL